MNKMSTAVHGLGVAPGWYSGVWVVMTAVWFVFRLFLDRGDPPLRILVLSGMYGAVWALYPWFLNRFDKRGRRAPAAGPDDVRRGAIVGLAVGVPFAAAFLALALVVGETLIFPGFYAVVLVAIAALGLVRLRGSREAAR